MCVWVKKTVTSPITPWADFARIVHNNSTPRRNHIFWAAFEYLYPFCIYGGVEFSVFHILWSWLLTQRIALPCIRVIRVIRNVVTSLTSGTRFRYSSSGNSWRRMEVNRNVCKSDCILRVNFLYQVWCSYYSYKPNNYCCWLSRPCWVFCSVGVQCDRGGSRNSPRGRRSLRWTKARRRRKNFFHLQITVCEFYFIFGELKWIFF